MLNNILDLNTITLNSALVIGGFTLLCVATLGYTSYSLINYFSAPAPDVNNIASKDVGIQTIKPQVDAAVQTTPSVDNVGFQSITQKLDAAIESSDRLGIEFQPIMQKLDDAIERSERLGIAFKNVEPATDKADVGVQTATQFLGTMSEDWFTDESEGLPARLIEGPGDFLHDDKDYVNNWQSQSLADPTNTASLNTSASSHVEAGVQATTLNVDTMVQATPSTENVGIQVIIQHVDAAMQTSAQVETALKNAELATAKADVGVQTSTRLLERMVTDLYYEGFPTDPSVPWTQDMLNEPAAVNEVETPNILLEDKSQVKNWLSNTLEVPTSTAGGTSQLSPLSEPLTPNSKVAAIDKELEALQEIKNSLDVPGDNINLIDPIIFHHNKYLEIKAMYSKELLEECISNTELLGIIQTFELADLASPDFNKTMLEIIQSYHP